MLKDQELAKHLPDTIPFSQKNLWKFVRKYREVIIKPTYGSRGKNIYKLSSLSKNKYQIHFRNEKYLFSTKTEAYTYLKNRIKTTPFVIQRFIPLLQLNSSPFDIRVMVQRVDFSSPWAVTGKIAKIAGEGFIVTNNRLSSGSVLPVKKALQQSPLNPSCNDIDFILDQIDQITLRAANSLLSYYKDQRVFGFDIAIDIYGRIWIIEVNLRPLLSHFKKLPNQTMFKIMKYKYKYKR